ncbi:peptide deformylase [Clostridium argentinense CDC 2741]|uniref:Peptide deformylase n=1 Tax=Clostridium argentinense CDC 2741 TaxID=1418104 RepID=A0A0C1R224_9CLOT|nr:peptide deformylase [Clostridium argentinense]ARC84665.1 peptide deformylase [Clostridium argentinense]KIE47472.1 peptide deformylase [Clostridium argentinense CDC 2741]NFF40174.1 peptide deformylase [Clostridium argentinense]NFP50623.1 peptide deformylase [Clostridium argentinense]NFP72429.1 peptide deformylase [Clostridium argentinense]
MAIRNIRTKEDEILRKKSKVVTNIDERLLTLINDMKETMYASNGVGLAAPQVGILKRVVVVDIGEGPIVLINPEIIEKRGEVTDIEGCLSVPGEQGEVKRPKYVKVKAMNEKGEEILLEGENFLARAFCHEIDHLDGILYIDKIVKEQEA